MTLENGHALHGSDPSIDGRAALLLAEGLLHVLVERSVITVADAMSAVQTAIEVTTIPDVIGGEAKARASASLEPLFRILDSLGTDADFASGESTGLGPLRGISGMK